MSVDHSTIAAASTAAPRRRRVPAPLIAFGVVYVLTCLIGALLMLANEHTFVALFEYFSGTRVPDLTGAQLRIDVVLLVVAPALFVVGYLVGDRVVDRLARRIGPEPVRMKFVPSPRWLPFAVFAACALWGMWSIVAAGNVGNIGSWLNYSSWIAARKQAFSQIGFFSYTNLYLFTPVAAAWCLITALPREGSQPDRSQSKALAGVALRWTPAAISVAYCLLLYQKKAALVALIIIAVARFAYAPPRLRRQRRVIVAIIAVGAALYLATVVLPVIRNAPSDDQLRAAAAAAAQQRHSARGPVVSEAPTILSTSRTRGLVLYAALSPLTRTSAPALYYPIIYPDRHPYYGLDLGQDVLGIGVSPDDNLVVWHFLNPNLAGTTATPFQFSLYSQVGLLGALLASFVVGLLLAGLWRFATARWIPREWRSLLTALIMLLAIYLAIDSARNSVLVSYGVIWPIIFIFALFAAAQLLGRRSTARTTRRTPEPRPVPGS